MTDEMRIAVAAIKLRLAGMHPTWIEFVKKEFTQSNPGFIEQLADELAEENDKGITFFTGSRE